MTRIVTRNNTNPGHELEYLPWIRAFRVTHYATKDAPPQWVLVPEGEVIMWIPAEGVAL